MKNSLRLTENELINVLSKMVKEARYSSVGNILRGGVRKKIKTIAILTGENPKGETASKEYNKNANQELKGLLKSARLGYRPIKGSYGTPENSFIINNISLDDAINIGEKFRQDTIVYGEVVGIDGDDINMNFKMVGTDPDKPKEYRKVIASNDVFIARNEAQDFFSEVGGRKFVIPFYGTIDRFKGENDKFFVKTKDYSDTKWKGGKAEPTSINIELDNELDELQERAIRTCCSTSYNLRGRIDKIIKENY
jgi:hypothetical protein